MKNTLKQTERLVSEIASNKNAKAQKTLERIIKTKLENRIRDIEARESK